MNGITQNAPSTATVASLTSAPPTSSASSIPVQPTPISMPVEAKEVLSLDDIEENILQLMKTTQSLMQLVSDINVHSEGMKSAEKSPTVLVSDYHKTLMKIEHSLLFHVDKMPSKTEVQQTIYTDRMSLVLQREEEHLEENGTLSFTTEEDKQQQDNMIDA